MASLTIDLTPEMERSLKAAARERGQDAADYARALLESKLAEVLSAQEETAEGEVPPGPGTSSLDPWAGLPQRTPEDLDALAREQDAPLAVRFEEALGDFWPEEESCDEFIAALRAWRREGVTSPSRGRQGAAAKETRPHR